MGIKDIMTNKISVKCSTKEEYIAFLKAAEKAEMRWGAGERPTQHFEYWGNEPIYLEYSLYGLVHGLNHCNGYTVVNFSELDLSDNYNEKYQLEIKQKNRSVIATLYDDKGAFVKYSKAKCSPEDEFDFETGKRIALQRLFGIVPKSEKGKDTCSKIELRWRDALFGIIGESAEVEACGHVNLFVGDVVELFHNGESEGLHCACKMPKNSKGFISDTGLIYCPPV